MPGVDARQADLLGDLEARGLVANVRALLGAFLRPLLEQVNRQGERGYTRFISVLLRSGEGERYCAALFHLTLTTSRILVLLRQVPSGPLQERLRLLSGMICTSVFNRVTAVDRMVSDAAPIDDALEMAAVGLRAGYALDTRTNLGHHTERASAADVLRARSRTYCRSASRSGLGPPRSGDHELKLLEGTLIASPDKWSYRTVSESAKASTGWRGIFEGAASGR